MKLVTLGTLGLTDTNLTRVKPLLLLAYVAIEGSKDRHHLAELMWPHAADPLNSLAAALKQLRQFAPETVVGDRTHISSAVECDAITFLQAADAGDDEEALRLYQGPFFSGIYLKGWSAELEEWVYGTREFLAGRARNALLRSGEENAANGTFEDAVKHAKTAYLLPGAPELEPEEMMRLHALLVAGNSPHLARLRKDAQGYGIELSLSPAVARKQLRHPLSSSPAPTHTLPTRGTSFVGRDIELAEIANQLDQPDCSLLTLTGPGGVGKSRLAVRIAHDLSERHLNGVYFIPLEALSAADLILPSIASILGLSLQGGEDPLIQVTRYVGNKATLLVLDNYEHLLDGATQVVPLLRACPNLKLLVTSRERLNLEEEWVFPLEGLAVPTDNLPMAEASCHDAIRLFAERAKRARPSFKLTPQELPHIVSICNQVQGLPLGIELAATWVKILSCQEIAQEIGQTIDFLSSSSRNTPERHKSIRTVFGQSWRRLTPKDQEVLRKLSIFRGSFSREAAAQVVGATIPALASLVDKSLLQVTTSGRYEFHPLLYQYTQEKLVEDESGHKETQQKHAAYFLALAEEAELELGGSNEATWFKRLTEEHDNLRAVLQQELESKACLRLAGALGRFWYVCGHLSEGREWLEKALSHPDTVGQAAAYSKALLSAGTLAWAQGDYDSARRLLSESLALQRKLIDKEGVAYSLNYLGLVAREQSDYTLARSLLEESLLVWRTLGDTRNIAGTLSNLGIVSRCQGKYALARSMYEESLTIQRELGYDRDIAISLGNLGLVIHAQGNCTLARSMYEESLMIVQALGDQESISALLGILGALACEQGDYISARSMYEKSLVITRKLGSKVNLAYSLEGFATVAVAQGSPERAARLWGAAEVLRETTGAPLPPSERLRYEDCVTVAQGQLGEAAFLAAWANGRTMPIERAIAYALTQAAT